MHAHARQEIRRLRSQLAVPESWRRLLTGAMDVPLSSGLASTPGILTSWEPAGVKPRLPLPQTSAKRRDEVRSRELLEGAAARDERPPIACAVPIPAPRVNLSHGQLWTAIQ